MVSTLGTWLHVMVVLSWRTWPRCQSKIPAEKMNNALSSWAQAILTFPPSGALPGVLEELEPEKMSVVASYDSHCIIPLWWGRALTDVMSVHAQIWEECTAQQFMAILCGVWGDWRDLAGLLIPGRRRWGKMGCVHVCLFVKYYLKAEGKEINTLLRLGDFYIFRQFFSMCC